MEKIRTVIQFPTLYSKNSNNKILEWIIKVDEYADDDTGVGDIYKVSIYSGLYGTSMDNIPNTFMVTSGKNLGKTNATTAKEQALKEATSKWQHKRERNHYRDLGDLSLHKYSEFLQKELQEKLDTNKSIDGFYIPMKCQKFWKTATKTKNGVKTKVKVPRINFPCGAQAKINGYRGTISVSFADNRVYVKSKNGVIYNIPHIEKAYFEFYSKLGKDYYDLTFDGELYIEGEILSEITSAAASTVKGSGNLKTPLLKHYVFDIIAEDIRQIDRTAQLKYLMENNTSSSIVHVETVRVENLEQALKLNEVYLQQGYEGTIFRDDNAFYQPGKRPKTIVKLKKRESAEFLIIDVIPDGKRPELGKFVCKNDLTDDIFEVTPEGTHTKRAEYLKNRENLIGKMLTVEFYERTIENKPFHAVGIVVRDYE